MFESEYSKAKALLEQHENIVITAHKSPDGDAIGSALALQHFLETRGLSAQVVVPDAYPNFLNWMEGSDDVVVFDQDERAKGLLNEATLIFCLDYNTPARVGSAMQEYLGLTEKSYILIDHHQNPDDFPNVVISDTQASSTAQLVYDFIIGLGSVDDIDKATAECLYAGLLTDTGSFRFPSTSVHTHEVVASLMSRGLAVDKVYNAIFDTNTLDRLQLLGYCLSEKLTVIEGYNAAYIALSEEELNRFGYKKGDTEGLVNYALSIEGVRFACLMKENQQEIRMSFRSKGEFDVNKLARSHFSGGGHKNAAGGVSKKSLSETVAAVEAMVKDQSELKS